MHTYPRVRPLKNTTMDRQIVLPRFKCLRWIVTDTIRVSYFLLSGPMMPQFIREEMQHIDGLVIEGWT